ncbi:hypothetical protein LSAT2_028077 [Lamellibrachia satsuma]|nr:hypothetical protein LSAT2_028077 [Lamellibrachia satsuma]
MLMPHPDISRAVAGVKGGWAKKQKQHRSRSLPTDQLQKVAHMSDMVYFENHLLEPFMRVRVSDTAANRKVQQVSFEPK